MEKITRHARLPEAYNSFGWKRYNIRGSRQANSAPNQWEEAIYHYTPKTGETHLKIVINRREGPSMNGDLWVDDIFVGTGGGFEQPPALKKPFFGRLTRVDQFGNFFRLIDGKWKPFFPRCMFGDHKRPDWGIYYDQGFNCDMWSGSIIKLAKAKTAGMASAYPISGYISPKFKEWGGYNNTGKLTSMLKKAKEQDLMDHIFLYYWDNEHAYDQWEVPINIIHTLHQLEINLYGARARPVYALQGNDGLARMYQVDGVPLTDIVGSYGGGDTGGVDTGSGALYRLDYLESQENPVSFVQINRGIGNRMRGRVYISITQGARAMGFWRDYYNHPEKDSVEKLEWWRDYKRISEEIDQMMPLIQQPHWTSWSAKVEGESSSVSLGTRDYNDEGYVILINQAEKLETATVKIHGLSYIPTAIYDYFSGERVTSVVDGTFSVELGKAGSRKETAVYRIAGR